MIFPSNETHIVEASSFCCINRLQNGALIAFTTLFPTRAAICFTDLMNNITDFFF